ncbi:hypothetical protein Tco_1085007 [Tanacetum coccineum]
MFDSIKVIQAQTKAIIDSLQDKLHDTFYENAKLRARLFDKVSEQKDTTKGTSMNTKFANQSTERKSSLQPLRNNFVVRQPNAFQSERIKFSKNWVPQKVDETNDLSKPVTSNSALSSRESTVVNNERVIAPGIFRINPFKASRVDNFVPNKHVKSSVRTKPITVSQPHVITKNDVNSKTNGFSPKDVKNTTRTRRPQPKSDKYVNGMKSRKKTQSANVSKSANQKKHKAQVWKPKNVGSKERFASPKPSKPRSCLRWSPTGRLFDLKGKIIASSKSKSQSDCSKGGQNWFDTLLILLLSEYKSKDKANHEDNECTDISEITRKQSKTSKHGHENQKSTKPKPEKSLSEIKDSENKGIVSTEMELVLEQTQQDTSHEVSYVNGMKSRKKNQSANVSKSANQKKHKAQVWKPKNVGSKERFASPKPSKPRSCLRWSPTGRLFDLKGKIIASSESESQSDCSKGGQNWFDTLLIPLLSEYKSKDKADHEDNECDT